MAKLVPKGLSDDMWKPLISQRDYAVLCNPDDIVYFRFGMGHGLYVSVEPTPSGRVVNALDFESGSTSLLGKLPSDAKVTLGRTSESAIKVMHAIISRQHLQMTLSKNVLLIRDMGSTNGTWLYKEIKHFDVAEYLESHSLENSQESTLDLVHEDFGMDIDDFLKNYSQAGKETN